MDYQPTEDQFVCILNKKVPVGNALNAIGHMTAGLVAQHKVHEAMRFQDYLDKDGTKHPSISDNPFIVLKAKNSNQIRTLRKTLTEKEIQFSDFTHTMLEGTYADQHKQTSETPEEELEYYGICFFMNAEQSKELTKKFSLYQ